METNLVCARQNLAQMPHPLEAIPFFRRFPKSLLRDVLYTLILSLFTTIVFSLIALLNLPTESFYELLRINAVFSLCIGYSIHLLSMIVGRTIRPWMQTAAASQRAILGIATAMIGGAAGHWLATSLLGLDFRFWSGTVIVTLWVGVTLTGTGIAQRRFTLSQLAYERERSARIEAERLVTVSRLQTLQAQIEPHFLFNTLANVSSLIEMDPKQARRMLDQFTLLLRASLDQTRKTTTPLRTELQVIDAYLSVLKVRMGERLSYRIDASPELHNLEVPSMFLQPVVENAVKHGIEPRMTGGIVQVQVRREDQDLLFVVTDDGVGFVPNGKENIGLGAVRERLAVQYGDAASLAIERTTDNLTRVTIRIPFPSNNVTA
jgi:sensor histidine kinase YesM